MVSLDRLDPLDVCLDGSLLCLAPPSVCIALSVDDGRGTVLHGHFLDVVATRVASRIASIKLSKWL